MKHTLLIVDDDPIELTQTRLMLEDQGYTVETAGSGDGGVLKVKEHGERYSLILLDYQMSGKDGAQTAKEMLEVSRDLYVIMYSNDKTQDAATEAWRAGAIDFIPKGEELPNFFATIKTWCKKFEQTRQTLSMEPSRGANEQLISSIGLAGCSSAMAAVVKQIGKYRQGEDVVLILGETGTGKEKIARALHSGPDSTYFTINCARYKDKADLLESELFGHEKGSFTGATHDKVGLLEKAKGTVFFDEAHHLSLQAQAKLLRGIGNRKGIRVGGYKEYSIECKLVFAAKPDFTLMKERGEIAEDFYYRLMKFVIEVPALRERSEDIAPLIAHFTLKYFGTYKDEAEKRFLMRTVRYLEKYPWPGNVRELEHLVDKLLRDAKDTTEARIRPEDLPKQFFDESALKLVRENEKGQDLITYAELKNHLEAEERRHILRVLKVSVSRTHAARRLRIALSTLHGVMKRLGIEFQDREPKPDSQIRPAKPRSAS